MQPPPDPQYRHRFPAEIVCHARVLSLSLRDVELLLAERGVLDFDLRAPRFSRAIACKRSIYGFLCRLGSEYGR